MPIILTALIEALIYLASIPLCGAFILSTEGGLRFGVGVSALLGREETVNADPELTEYLSVLRDRPEMRMLFSLTKDATKEDVETAVRLIEALRGKE